jgi:CrcB protein
VTVLLIAIGAAAGAPARYVTDRVVQSRHDTVFPWGTLTVNVMASLILGVVIGADPHGAGTVAALVGTGFCGALSTYSAFSYETLHLAQEGATFLASVNVAVSVGAGLGAAALGWSLGMSVL